MKAVFIHQSCVVAIFMSHIGKSKSTFVDTVGLIPKHHRLINVLILDVLHLNSIL